MDFSLADATRSLKRILRDVLRDAVAIRERIKTLEEISGLGGNPGPGPGPSQGQATVTGSITATAGSSWTQVGQDAIQLVAASSLADGSMRLKRILYRCGCSPFMNVIFSLLGARGEDLAFTLNPFAGLGPGPLTCQGNPLHQERLGAGLGTAMATDGFWLSLGAFRGWVAHAWLQERQLLGSRGRTWGASAGPYPGGRQLAWAVAAGGEAEGAWAPQTLEASCQLSLGDGLILSPGLLARASPASTTVTALIKSSWSF
ncbi:hypothetical protein QBZ16_000923 [Prototheca wickerhamii]|uniref:Uncharacterized protein n=1 Tax=Prototheca wickerhamii TaxID=3111 RepID=A0AAD9MKH9_PROWI|nr:hypothetical protein QBZ16_000923 [Prototheca wickerhamii]